MTVRGCLDIATCRRLAGWAQDPATPETAVTLLIVVDDRLVARIVADGIRPDLTRAGMGSGRHGFDLRFPRPLAPQAVHSISVRREHDGVHCPGSPFTLAPADPVAQAVVDQLDLGCSDAQLDVLARDRAVQVERLLALRAARRSGRVWHPGLAAWQARWADARAESGPRPGELRALMIDERLPVPGCDGGSNALLSHAAALQRLGYAVTMVASDLGGGDAAAALQRLGIAVCQRPWYASVEEVLRLEPGAFDLVYLHRLQVAECYLPLLRLLQPTARLLYAVADLHHLRQARQAAVQGRPELAAAAEQTRARELVAAWTASAVLTHSPVEAALLRDAAPAASVHVVPWAVPLRPTPVAWADRHGFAFIANYSHAPNRDAVLWLLEDILPLVRQADASLRCLLAGADLPPRLAEGIDGVDVVGQVAALGTLFDRVRLTIAPLTFGAGIKAKVLDSMAAGIPCVMTPIAAEGLDLPPLLRGLVATDAANLAALVRRVHDDAALNQAVSAAGLAFVRTTCGERRVDRALRGAAGLPALAAELDVTRPGGFGAMPQISSARH